MPASKSTGGGGSDSVDCVETEKASERLELGFFFLSPGLVDSEPVGEGEREEEEEEVEEAGRTAEGV